MSDLATTLPMIISVDDHVVEPPHLWQDRLPAKLREQGPRVERARWGDFALGVGASYKQEMTDDGRWGDYWLYEDRLIYVHKRHVAIPLDATPDGDVATLRSQQDVHRRDDLRRDATRLLRAEGARRRSRARGCRRLARVPDVPAILRADVHGGPRSQENSLECVRHYNDWMIEDWCADSNGALIPLCLIPLWDVDLAVAEVARNAARGARAICFSEIPTHLGLPSIHTGYWDPLFAMCQETRTVLCMHIGSSSKMPAASPDAPPDTAIMLSFNNSMASLADFLFSGVLVRFPTLKLAYSEGQIGWIPYALERADNVWEYHSSWTGSKRTIPEPPSTYYRGRIFGCFTNDMHGMVNIEGGRKRGQRHFRNRRYPHTDTTWPFAHEEVERMTASLTDAQRHKTLLR